METLTGEIDLFDLYRWLLATVCTIYVLVYTAKSLLGWLKYFASSRETAVLGRYTTVLLLRLRFRRFFRDLVEIVVLSLIFALLAYCHYRVGHPT